MRYILGPVANAALQPVIARAVAALAGCPGTESPDEVSGCRSDQECKGDRICESGACVAPRPAEAGAIVVASEEWAEKEGRTPLARVLSYGTVADDFLPQRIWQFRAYSRQAPASWRRRRTKVR